MAEHSSSGAKLDPFAIANITQKMKQFKQTPNRVELISLLLRHFVHTDSLNKEEYLKLRGSEFKSAFKGGQRGAVSALQYSLNPRPWMKTTQDRIGDIVVVQKSTHNEDIAVITDIWKAHIRAVWHKMYGLPVVQNTSQSVALDGPIKGKRKRVEAVGKEKEELARKAPQKRCSHGHLKMRICYIISK
jgi:hypothetical protein